MSMSILPPNKHATAQAGLFTEAVKVYLDKDIYNGAYGIRVKNLDTGAEVFDSKYSNTGSDRSGYIPESIAARDGDTVEACVMDMSSEAIECDTCTAYKDGSPTEVFIDMASAN